MSEGQFKREEAEHLAAAIASIDPDDPESYFSRVDKLLKERKVGIPCIRISYTGLNVVKDAVSSAGALPSLPNVLLMVAKVLVSLLHARFCVGAHSEAPIPTLASRSNCSWTVKLVQHAIIHT